jgi:GT2 family glycosyltransferase
MSKKGALDVPDRAECPTFGGGSLRIRRIAVLVTSHNRRERTLASLQALFAQNNSGEWELTVFLVDDGSKDGTGHAIAARFPQVRLLKGDGSLYWGGGTRKAYAVAMEEGFDAYLWLNDDVRLFEDAICRIVACAEEAVIEGKTAIVAGSLCDPKTGAISYGGYQVRKSGLRIYFDSIIPDTIKGRPCDAVNGNFVLIPHSIAQVLGNLDIAFRHYRGDLDYGLRGKKAGFSVLIGPGYYGECLDESTITGTWRDESLPFRKRWAHLTSVKGNPVGEIVLFTRRHFGWRWPFYALSPYVKLLLGLRC